LHQGREGKNISYRRRKGRRVVFSVEGEQRGGKGTAYVEKKEVLPGISREKKHILAFKGGRGNSFDSEREKEE